MNRFLTFSVAILIAACGGDSKTSDSGFTPQADTVTSADQSASDEGSIQDGESADLAVAEDTSEKVCGPAGSGNPGARAELFGVYDPNREQLVFWGGHDVLPENCTTAVGPVGLNGLWTYDTACATFEQVAHTGGPTGRARGMTIYDTDQDQMVIFGGRRRVGSSGPYEIFNESWSLDLETMTWTQIQTTGPVPTKRSNPAGGYNQLTKEMILFGGNSSTSGASFIPHDDVWALNLETSTWREITATGPKPDARLFHSAAVDAQGARLFIYGGGDENALFSATAFMADLWVFDLNTGVWTQLDSGASGGPMPRIWATITYDEINDRVLLFGGHDNGQVGNNNDTWAFNLSSNTWQNLIEPQVTNAPANGFCDFPPDFILPNMDAPERRSAHLAGLDTTRGEWVVFGGKTDCGMIDDVWVFSLMQDAWVRLAPATIGESCNRGGTPELCVAMCQ